MAHDPPRKSARKGVPASAYDSADPRLLFGSAGVEQEVVNKKGLRLAAYFWPAAEPKAVLLFVHGHGGHLLFEVLKGAVRTLRA